ncbi:hypothetical protein QBC39DRAFT_94695 [Podospora conica]|nr:hypothetical protein QBC39DRAFT_94695 [Schizothecium conicum]
MARQGHIGGYRLTNSVFSPLVIPSSIVAPAPHHLRSTPSIPYHRILLWCRHRHRLRRLSFPPSIGPCQGVSLSSFPPILDRWPSWLLSTASSSSFVVAEPCLSSISFDSRHLRSVRLVCLYGPVPSAMTFGEPMPSCLRSFPFPSILLVPTPSSLSAAPGLVPGVPEFDSNRAAARSLAFRVVGPGPGFRSRLPTSSFLQMDARPP